MTRWRTDEAIKKQCNDGEVRQEDIHGRSGEIDFDMALVKSGLLMPRKSHHCCIIMLQANTWTLQRVNGAVGELRGPPMDVLGHA